MGRARLREGALDGTGNPERNGFGRSTIRFCGGLLGVGAAPPGKLAQANSIKLARPAAFVPTALRRARRLLRRRPRRDLQRVAVVRTTLPGERLDAQKVLACARKPVNQQRVGGLAEDPYRLVV